jgi:hypothetical protein
MCREKLLEFLKDPGTQLDLAEAYLTIAPGTDICYLNPESGECVTTTVVSVESTASPPIVLSDNTQDLLAELGGWDVQAAKFTSHYGLGLSIHLRTDMTAVPIIPLVPMSRVRLQPAVPLVPMT